MGRRRPSTSGEPTAPKGSCIDLTALPVATTASSIAKAALVLFVSKLAAAGTIPTGVTGSAGSTGPTGPTGTNGTNGSTGPTGPTGAAGPNGTNGTNGATDPTSATGGPSNSTYEFHSSFATTGNSVESYNPEGVISNNAVPLRLSPVQIF
jgi:hypothetical protein